MSHELDISTGQAAVFVTGEPAWHKLGMVVANAVTSAQAIELARLNWEVEQWELKAFDRELGKEAYVQGKYANVRKDTGRVLGVVSEHYRIFQNRECFDFMDSLVADRLAMFESAGALKDGRVVWMLARIPAEYRAGADDVVQPYILLTNSHDGSKALRIFPTTIRVVCQNTLRRCHGPAYPFKTCLAVARKHSAAALKPVPSRYATSSVREGAGGLMAIYDRPAGFLTMQGTRLTPNRASTSRWTVSIRSLS